MSANARVHVGTWDSLGSDTRCQVPLSRCFVSDIFGLFRGVRGRCSRVGGSWSRGARLRCVYAAKGSQSSSWGTARDGWSGGPGRECLPALSKGATRVAPCGAGTHTNSGQSHLGWRTLTEYRGGKFSKSVITNARFPPAHADGTMKRRLLMACRRAGVEPWCVLRQPFIVPVSGAVEITVPVANRAPVELGVRRARPGGRRWAEVERPPGPSIS